MNDKQRRFVSEYLIDMNATQAAIRSGYSPRSAASTASHLMDDPEIARAIAEQRAAIAERANVTVASLLVEAEQARCRALAADQPGAAVAATTLKAKLCGLMIERTEDMTRREELERQRRAQGELRTAADLLAAAACSLGLPPSATPAQIVGELATRPIATPEAFALLRAGHLTDEDVPQ